MTRTIDDFIIGMFQSYQSAWSKILGATTYLEYSREKGEIILVVPRGVFPVKVAKKQGIRKELSFQEVYQYLYVIQTVDIWLGELSSREREAIFYRFISHSYVETTARDWSYGMWWRWQTMSYEEIAKKMGVDRKTAYRLVQSGLGKIKQMVSKGG